MKKLHLKLMNVVSEEAITAICDFINAHSAIAIAGDYNAAMFATKVINKIYSNYTKSIIQPVASGFMLTNPSGNFCFLEHSQNLDEHVTKFNVKVDPGNSNSYLVITFAVNDCIHTVTANRTEAIKLAYEDLSVLQYYKDGKLTVGSYPEVTRHPCKLSMLMSMLILESEVVYLPPDSAVEAVLVYLKDQNNLFQSIANEDDLVSGILAAELNETILLINFVNAVKAEWLDVEERTMFKPAGYKVHEINGIRFTVQIKVRDEINRTYNFLN